MLVIKDKTKNKFIEIGNIVQPLKNDLTQVEAGKYALDAAQGYKLNGDIANRVEKNQGAENSGKYLVVGADGNVNLGNGGQQKTKLFETTLTETATSVFLGEDNYHFLRKYKKILFYCYIPKNNDATGDSYLRVAFAETSTSFTYHTIFAFTNSTATYQPLLYSCNTSYLHIINIDYPYMYTSRYNNAFNNTGYPQPMRGTIVDLEAAYSTTYNNYDNYICAYCEGSAKYPAFPIGTKFVIYGVE